MGRVMVFFIRYTLALNDIVGVRMGWEVGMGGVVSGSLLLGGGSAYRSAAGPGAHF